MYIQICFGRNLQNFYCIPPGHLYAFVLRVSMFLSIEFCWLYLSHFRINDVLKKSLILWLFNFLLGSAFTQLTFCFLNHVDFVFISLRFTVLSCPPIGKTRNAPVSGSCQVCCPHYFTPMLCISYHSFEMFIKEHARIWKRVVYQSGCFLLCNFYRASLGIFVYCGWKRMNRSRHKQVCFKHCA